MLLDFGNRTKPDFYFGYSPLLALGLPVWGVILVAVAMAILSTLFSRKSPNLIISSQD